MKLRRRLSIMLALALVLCLVLIAGCDKQQANTTTTTANAATTAASVPAPDNTASAAATDPSTATPAQNTETAAPTPVAAVPDGVKTGGTLLMSAAAEPTNLNPNGNYDANNGYLIQNVFNRLIKTNSMQQILPDLASNYEVSGDGLQYTFHLLENVYFHDGEKFSSDDVKFTLEYIMENSTFMVDSLANIKSIDCPDDNTVVINMTTIDASLLYNLAYQGTFILPRHVYEGKDWAGADAMQTPVGTGPFIYDSWDRGSRITLIRNPNFFLGAELPYLDKVIFAFIADATTAKTAFMAGDYDILGVFTSTDFMEMRNHGSIDMEVNIYPSRFIVEFNMATAPFNDVNLRRAVSYAINNDEMMTIALKEVGLEAKHFISPLYEWAVDSSVTLPEYDLEKANQLMAETGLTKDANGNYLSVTVDTMNYAPFPDVAQVFKSQMAKIGIDVTINMVEYALFDEKVVRNKDFVIGITSDYQGPEVSAISGSIASDGYNNCTGYNNPAVDKLLTDALNLASFEERAPLYKQVQKHMQEDLPYYIISEWVGYFPHWDYVINHPGNESARDKTNNYEFTYTWLNH